MLRLKDLSHLITTLLFLVSIIYRKILQAQKHFFLSKAIEKLKLD